jgi:hypothetical protein
MRFLLKVFMFVGLKLFVGIAIFLVFLIVICSIFYGIGYFCQNTFDVNF